MCWRSGSSRGPGRRPGRRRERTGGLETIETQPKNRLWTYDFTVITIGSVVSMVGGTLSGFAVSLVVLDYTSSTFLYVLFNVCYQLPMLVCPILAGPCLDRVSRKRVIYTLDFASAAIFFVLFLLLRTGWFNYPAMLLACILIGAINGVYIVAYDSFYPNLITEGNYRRAYSVSSMLWPLAAMTTPVAAAIYDLAGSATPIFAANAVCFFLAACFECTIRHRETHMDQAPPADGWGPMRRFRRDLREGLAYIRGEKGLLAISLYFMCANFTYGVDSLQLPFFRNNAELFAAVPMAAVTLYAVVSNWNVVGRFVGGLIQYRVAFPKEKKFAIAITVYVTTSVLAGCVLFLPVPLMMAAFFLQGILGVTSYTIRTAATQSYVPDTKRARFNGTFQMMVSLGSILGNLTAGALAEVFPERSVILGVNLLGVVLVYVFIYRGRQHVARIYNRDL